MIGGAFLAAAALSPTVAATQDIGAPIDAIVFELCPKLLARPADLQDTALLQRFSLLNGKRIDDLWVAKDTDQSQLAVGVTFSAGVDPDGKWREGNACVVAFSGERRDALIERLRQAMQTKGFALIRENELYKLYAVKDGAGFRSVELKIGMEGRYLDFFDDPSKPVVYLTVNF
jgi:hypothetical protein